MAKKSDLTEIVGTENVLDSPEILQEYSRDESFALPIRPGCVVKPSKTSELERIIKLANETSTPLVPISSGPPHFLGDTVPNVGGAAIVDCSGMNQILRIDRRNRVTMIEPGVTFGELIPALKKQGLAPLMPLIPRSSKSVVTSFLERTPITMPRFHWEPQDPLLCVEVIYGSGDLLRTGSAVGPGSLEEQWEVGRAQIRGMGPSQVDFTRLLQGAQGTMGIVTWATIRCRPLPKIRKAFLVPSEDVGPLIEMAYRITYKKLGEELLILNNVNLASILGRGRKDIETLRAQLPSWVLFFGIEGAGLLPEEKVGYQEEEFVEVVHSLGLEVKAAIPGASAEDVSKALSQPSTEPYWKLKYQGGCTDIFFITTLDKTPGFIDAVCGLAERYRYSVKNMGVYIQPTVQGTNAHLEFNFSYDPENQVDVDKMRQFAEQGSEVLANREGFFSRPYGSWARIAYGCEAQTVIGQRKLKEIFDPKGIMNPGKLCF